MKTILLVITLTFCSLSFAGPGHSHGHEHESKHSHGPTLINEVKAKELGQTHIARLIKVKKIDDSWANSTFDRAEKKTFNDKAEWVVTFNNEMGVKGKKLYIFLNLGGEFIAANFTGK